MSILSRKGFVESRRFVTAILVVLILGTFILSDPYFSYVEDETAIITAARHPASMTVKLFVSGNGQHEHPPLSDIVLHFWLPVAGQSLTLLRVPSIVFFLVGLVLLAVAAEKVSKRSAFLAVIIIGAVSPFTFHFARMAGWYSFCFFLVSALTCVYLRYIETASGAALCCFVTIAVALVYSNYYGWVIVGCLLVDCWAVRRSGVRRLAFVAIGVMVLAYAPLWRAFFRETINGSHAGTLVSRIALGAYSLYVLFVSESVAPWIWYFAVPTSAALALALQTSWISVNVRQRLFLLYFAVCFVGLTVTGKVESKRLLFISPWLILVLGVAWAEASTGLRRRMGFALVILASAGWLGIVTRKWYAAPHFIEPWKEVADKAAQSVRNGGLVVSNSPAFSFYINYALARDLRRRDSFLPGWINDPRVLSVEQLDQAFAGDAKNIVFVQGVNQNLIRQTVEFTRRIEQKCTLLGSENLVPDAGSALKERFFPQFKQPRFRITIQRYLCPEAQIAGKNSGA